MKEVVYAHWSAVFSACVHFYALIKNVFDLVLDVERQKEEMAWQMAAIIVSDVTSRAEPDKPETET